MQEDDPTLQAPGAGASDQDKQLYQMKLSSYKEAVKDIDNIHLNSDFQSYADIINDPAATDSEKLQAYSNYRVDSVVADTSFGSYQSSDQDFKFDWLTRDSDFMRRVNSGDVSGYYSKQAVARAQSPTHQIDFEQDTANLIDAGSRLTYAQQGVIAINVASMNLMCAILNGNKASLINDPKAQNVNRTPGFEYQGAKPVDAQTAIASAVAASMKELSLSAVGCSMSPANVAYKNLYVQLVQSVAQRAASRMPGGVQQTA